MRLNSRLAWFLGSVVFCVDAATTANVYALYSYFEEPVFALLVSLSFILLQVGTLVLYAQPLPDGIRAWLQVGAAILLSITGIANVAVGFLHARQVFPADNLLPVFGVAGMDATSLTVLASFIAGLSLVIVALIFWTALGTFVRFENQRQEVLSAQLQEIFMNKKEGE